MFQVGLKTLHGGLIGLLLEGVIGQTLQIPRHIWVGHSMVIELWGHMTRKAVLHFLELLGPWMNVMGDGMAQSMFIIGPLSHHFFLLVSGVSLLIYMVGI